MYTKRKRQLLPTATCNTVGGAVDSNDVGNETHTNGHIDIIVWPPFPPDCTNNSVSNKSNHRDDVSANIITYGNGNADENIMATALAMTLIGNGIGIQSRKNTPQNKNIDSNTIVNGTGTGYTHLVQQRLFIQIMIMM